MSVLLYAYRHVTSFLENYVFMVTARKQSLILDNGERTYRLSEFARMIDEKPCQKTVWLWCTKGFRAVKLECIMSPSGLRTSVEAYSRFQRAIQENFE